MGPVPDEQQDNPADNDPPSRSDPDELETPSHIIPPGDDFSSDDDDGEVDSDAEGPAGGGYMLLPQDPEGEEGGGDTFHPQPYTIPDWPEGVSLPPEPMTEVRGAGVDISEAVAGGNVHPGFAAQFPDNTVPVHLQVPDLTKGKKEDVLWNQTPQLSERLQLDSAHLQKVKTAMAGFQLPQTHIPDWAQRISENQWKEQLVDKLTSPGSSTDNSRLHSHRHSKQAADTAHVESCGKQAVDTDTDWPGTSGT